MYHEGNGAPYLSFWNIPKYHRTLSERHNNTLIHRIIKHNYQIFITRSRDPWATSFNMQKGLVLHLKYRSPSHWMHCSVELLIGKVVLKKTIFPIVWSFIWTNLFLIYPRMLCAMLIWIWFSGSRKKINKRPKGLNGHLSIRNSRLTSCQKGSYLHIRCPIIE